MNTSQNNQETKNIPVTKITKTVSKTKLEKLQIRLARLTEVQRKTNETIKHINNQISILKQDEQSKLIKKITTSPEAIRGLLDAKIISQEDYNLLVQAEEKK